MYLAEIFAENFRIFGPESEGKALQLSLKPGLNALVGENDGGKSAIIDAIRFCLWTTSQDYHRLTIDDFHCGSARKSSLTIRCMFKDLSIDDQAAFLEWLTTGDERVPILYIHLKATLINGGRGGKVSVEVHAGKDGSGGAVEGTMRELLRTTYLRPLRDAEAELSPGRNSRLSQILGSHPGISAEGDNDFDPADKASGKTLVGIMKRAEHEVSSNGAVRSANETITREYLDKFRIGAVPLSSEVSVAGDTTLGRILEKLELVISKSPSHAERTRRGLGYNNVLFMSAELLLLGSREAYPTLLIEEPEAHLHPQMQASVISLLAEKARVDESSQEESSGPQPRSRGKSVQVIMSTHSPYLAAAIPLEQISLISAGRTYSLEVGKTLLDASDYAFLERFLDATKANLFFARGVAIVEGDAENLLLPIIAEKVGYSFRQLGLSVVNVGHTGLFRYSKIFQRADSSVVPIRVACLRDRDIVPSGLEPDLRGELKQESDFTPETLAGYMDNLRRGDGGCVKTFVSDHWTFEFDLAAASWELAEIMYAAAKCAVQAKNGPWPQKSQTAKNLTEARDEINLWKVGGKSLVEVAVETYRPLRKKAGASKSIAAQFAAMYISQRDLTAEMIPAYLQDSFAYMRGA